mmetsp:Transcript_11510/g.16398  ORF Transcript_11510/g.16398 Transcript_11510/m.16398 type:complete len:139 (-) Transcript_11510:59-475(-)
MRCVADPAGSDHRLPSILPRCWRGILLCTTAGVEANCEFLEWWSCPHFLSTHRCLAPIPPSPALFNKGHRVMSRATWPLAVQSKMPAVLFMCRDIPKYIASAPAESQAFCGCLLGASNCVRGVLSGAVAVEWLGVRER